MSDRRMNSREAAELLGRSMHTVRLYCRMGLPHHRQDGRLVFLESEVRRWMDRPSTKAMLLSGDVVKYGRQALAQ